MAQYFPRSTHLNSKTTPSFSGSNSGVKLKQHPCALDSILLVQPNVTSTSLACFSQQKDILWKYLHIIARQTESIQRMKQFKLVILFCLPFCFN